MKTSRKSERQRLVIRCDEWVSKIIRLKGKNKCVICGDETSPTNGHVFSRGNYSLRWDLRDDGNCHVQCHGCNLRHEYDPYPYYHWYVKTYGQERFDELHREWNVTTQIKDWRLKEMKEEFKQIFKDLGE